MGPGWDQPRPAQTPVLWFGNHSRLQSTMTLQPAVTLMSPLSGSNDYFYSSSLPLATSEWKRKCLLFYPSALQTHFSYYQGKDRSVIWYLTTNNTVVVISWPISKVSPWPQLLFLGVVQIIFRSWREAEFWDMGFLPQEQKWKGCNQRKQDCLKGYIIIVLVSWVCSEDFSEWSKSILSG